MSHPQNFDKLTELVRAQTFRLMEYGGTTPEATCDVIADEAPIFMRRSGRIASSSCARRFTVPKFARSQNAFRKGSAPSIGTTSMGAFQSMKFGQYTTRTSG